MDSGDARRLTPSAQDAIRRNDVKAVVEGGMSQTMEHSVLQCVCGSRPTGLAAKRALQQAPPSELPLSRWPAPRPRELASGTHGAPDAFARDKSHCDPNRAA